MNRKKKKKNRLERRLVLLFVAVILVLITLAADITRINVRDGGKYSRIVLSQAQQQYTDRTIPFRRGDITDRNGTLLATSKKYYRIILDCKVVNAETYTKDEVKKKRFYQPTIDALHDVLGIKKSKIKKLLDDPDTKDSQYQVLEKNVSITQKRKFEAYTDRNSKEFQKLSDEEKTRRDMIRGVWFEDSYERVYPLNSLACDAIGFTMQGNTAQYGLEGYYSDTLNGTDGRQYGYYNSDSDLQQTIIPAKAGQNVVSTLDVSIQQILRKSLENFNDRMSKANGSILTAREGEQLSGAKHASILVMNPKNGEVLGMDSTKWYNLNKPRDLTPFYSSEELKNMSDADMLKALNEIWENDIVTMNFEPGSTVKPITAAAALETGAITTEDQFVCNGYEKVADTTIKCTAVHGTENLQQSLQHSCNDALMQIGAKLGSKALIKYQKLFGFGSRTGIDISNEGEGVLYSEQKMGPVELATSSFGQGFTCTMIQEAAAFSAVINGGNYYKPHVASKITDQNGATVKTMDPVLERRVCSKSISDEIRKDLVSVVEPGGSGAKAKVEGYSMGGKTGTAEKLPRKDGRYLVSFIGFAPADDPQVVVYVTVDEPKAKDQANNMYATTLAKEVFTELLPYMNIFPEKTSD